MLGHHMKMRTVLGACYRHFRHLWPLAVACGISVQGALIAFPEFSQLAAGSQQVRLLSGQEGCVFTLYGTPGDLDQLKQVVSVMRQQGLGNGFDPGPAVRAASKPLFDYLASVGWPVVAYPGCADMQIKGGRCVLTLEDEAALGALDRAGVFSAIQLGEWGYYFHNLAPNERWWRDVYGQDFETMKHLMKPAGLAGYDTCPTSRQECYNVLKDYFTSRSSDLRNRLISVTGHSHYEAYAGEWGARCIGLELGENIAFTQSKMAFARGAAKQWQKPWSVQVSPWFHGACTTTGPLRGAGGDARGLDAGHSLSFYERMWLHAWFAGAAMVTPENSLAIFFEQPSAPWRLTTHGQKAVEVFQFLQTHGRGVPWMPVAILLDHYSGYNGYMGKPWGILQPTPGDLEVRDLFDHQLFPGSDHIHSKPDPANPEGSYLRPTPWGEIFDVLLSGATSDVLASYPVILLAGDIEFDEALVSRLQKALGQGSKLLMGARHRQALGPLLSRLAGEMNVEVLEPWINDATGRPAAISARRLEQLVREYLPIEVSGDPIQYQINRTLHGWIVELVNNDGVIKRPDAAAVVDPAAVRRVLLSSRVPGTTVNEWRSGRRHSNTQRVQVDLGPGTVEFVEFPSQ